MAIVLQPADDDAGRDALLPGEFYDRGFRAVVRPSEERIVGGLRDELVTGEPIGVPFGLLPMVPVLAFDDSTEGADRRVSVGTPRGALRDQVWAGVMYVGYVPRLKTAERPDLTH